MRKAIIAIYILPILLAISACNNNDEPEAPKYLDNKLIEGTWFGIYGKDSMVYTFENNMASYELYAFIQGMDSLKYEGKDDLGNYRLTDSLILMSKPTDFRFIYQLSKHNDSLYIRNPIDDPILWIGLKKN